MRSGRNTYAYGAYRLNPDGSGLDYGKSNLRYAVRPASSNAVNFKKAADIPRFLGLSFVYNAWLRSGFNGNAYYAYLLNSNGGSVYRNTGNRAAVRPALHLFAEKFIADNSRIRLV